MGAASSIVSNCRPGWRGRAALAATCVLGGTVGLVGPASAVEQSSQRVPTIVALGDSFSAGVGTRSYYGDSGSCQRSPYAYPVIDAGRVGASLSFRACSGATTTSVLNTQLDTLTPRTTYVTITVGGNDAGFSRVITECAQPWWAADCHGAIDDSRAYISETLPSRLDAVYRAIESRAPDATVVVVGYPRIFMGEDCNAGTWFSPSEQTRLNSTADLLDTTTAGRASAYGFEFADPRATFTGHAVCDELEWVNGLSDPVSESYHPNRKGQTGYANLVDDYLT
ncbi:MAG: SGNH/GDSL hydrolase family protein [Nocardioidaceae bacterium]|nr:SGNH/GDSL hydrolase family protein [Nocardioidaceae bacterium]